MTNRKIIPIKVNDKTIMVEVEDIEVISPKTEKTPSRADSREKVLTSTLTGDKLIENIVDIADSLEAIVGAVDKGMDKVKPDEWSVELNMGFSLEGSAFVAKGKVDSNFKVTAKWVNKDKPKPAS